MTSYLTSNEAPFNAQLVGSTGTVNTVSHATRRASQHIQKFSSKVPSSGSANYGSHSAGH